MNRLKQIREQIDMLEELFFRIEEIKIEAKEKNLSDEQTLNILDCVYTSIEFKHQKRIEILSRSIFADLQRQCEHLEIEDSEK